MQMQVIDRVRPPTCNNEEVRGLQTEWSRLLLSLLHSSIDESDLPDMEIVADRGDNAWSLSALCTVQHTRFPGKRKQSRGYS